MNQLGSDLQVLTNHCSKLTNIDYQTDELVQINQQILKRLKMISNQQELLTSVILEMVRAEDREDLNNRVDLLLNRR